MDIDKYDPDVSMALTLRNVSKAYDKGKIPVLKNLNMNVPTGTIYGLLGASGCGKTTLFSVAVGLLKHQGGEVNILGGPPGQRGSGVPGPRVGYMPQDSALVDELTVYGALRYFGWLAGMTSAEVETRFAFLARLLELPPNDQMVSTLSGGQQRRLSFAAAVLHSPELLILDEPTVGLDPILRQNIWEYMVNLSVEDGVTILFSTHYIEEAKQANVVSLLREGVLLAETSPQRLLSKYSCTTLEEVFLLLSEIQSKGRKPTVNDNVDNIELKEIGQSSVVDSVKDVPSQVAVTPAKKAVAARQRSFWARMKALLYKNVLKTFRNIPGILFNFIYPLVFMLAFFLGIGRDPEHLPVAVINHELGDCRTLPGGIGMFSGASLEQGEEEYETLCNLRGVSCLILDALDQKNTTLHYYDTLEEGLHTTETGATFATLLFHQNFSAALQERQYDTLGTSDAVLNASNVKVWMDMAEFTNGNVLKQHFYDRVQDVIKNISRQCNYSEKVGTVGLKLEDPVYGRTDISFNDFMSPGMIVAMVYLLAIIMTSSEVVKERAEGLWNRNVVAGVSEMEIIVAHVLAQLITMLCQVFETFVFSVLIFGVEVHGSVVGALVLVFLQGICGASLGLLFSVLTTNISQATLLSMGSFYPFLLLCGVAWPIEGMPPWLRTISELSPGTWPITALRNIFSRGWPLSHPHVYIGYIVTVAWIVMLAGLSVIGLKLRKL